MGYNEAGSLEYEGMGHKVIGSIAFVARSCVTTIGWVAQQSAMESSVMSASGPPRVQLNKAS